jgi:hypothetical protein
MKPNGKHFIVRAVAFAFFAATLFSGLGKAETVNGKFKLPTETRWGGIVLAPGDYEFTFDSQAAGRVLVVQSRQSKMTSMVMPRALSDVSSKNGSGLELAESEAGTYVKRLYLGDLGIALNFGAPRPGKGVSLTKSKPATTVASASGTH